MLLCPLYLCCLSGLSSNSICSDTIPFLLVVQPLGRLLWLNGHWLLICIKSVGLKLVNVDNDWIGLKMGHGNQQSCVVGQSVLNSIGSKPSTLEFPDMLLLPLRIPEDIIPQLKVLLRVVLLTPQGSAPLPFSCHLLSMVSGNPNLISG
jgi:hypothetical protein